MAILESGDRANSIFHINTVIPIMCSMLTSWWQSKFFQFLTHDLFMIMPNRMLFGAVYKLFE